MQRSRLNEISRNIVLYGPQGIRLSLPEVLALNPSGILSFLKGLKVEKQQKPILHAILPGILERLGFMEKVGLDYLSMDRETSSLSGERLKESGWPVNSAQTYLACSTYSTNLPSVSIRSITKSLLDPCATCKQGETRWSWSSMTLKPLCRPIT